MRDRALSEGGAVLSDVPPWQNKATAVGVPDTDDDIDDADKGDTSTDGRLMVAVTLPRRPEYPLECSDKA